MASCFINIVYRYITRDRDDKFNASFIINRTYRPPGFYVIYNNAREISSTVRRYLAVRPSSIEIQQILRKHRIYHGFEACQAASLLSLGLAGIFSDLAATCNAVYPVEERK